MQEHLTDPNNLYSLAVPFSRKRESELYGHKSTTVRFSLDDPDKWPNCIFENSRHAIFIWHQCDNSMVLLCCGSGMSRKFRKQPCKSAEQFLDKINRYITAHLINSSN